MSDFPSPPFPTGAPGDGTPVVNGTSEGPPVVHEPGESAPVIHEPGDSTPALHEPGESVPVLHEPSESASVVNETSESTLVVHEPGQSAPAGHEPNESMPVIHESQAENLDSANAPGGDGTPALHGAIEAAPVNHESSDNAPVVPEPSEPAPVVHEPTETSPVLHDPLAEDLELALDDFRSWFVEAADGPAGLPAEQAPPIDLATILGHFVGLRQEVNLQTRAVRAQQEQTTDSLTRLQQALDLCSRSQMRAEQLDRGNADEKLRPLLSTLADLYDSLSTAAGQIRRVTAGVLPQLQDMLEPEPDEDVDEPEESPPAAIDVPQARSFWSRWILSPAADAAIRASQVQTQQARTRLQQHRQLRRQRIDKTAEACEQVEQALSTLLLGYTMNIERIGRSLQKHGLVPIETVGELFDPERMEVLEPVVGTGRPAGEVIEEVQRGYTYNGRIFRFARVRVARD